MTPILGIIASSFRSAAGPDGAYDALATITVPSGGLATITFAGIPNTYKHLQIRMMALSNRATFGVDALLMRFNGDSGMNYSQHTLNGNGTSALASGQGTGSISACYVDFAIGTTVSSYPGVAIIDVLDYANASKNKVMRGLGGTELNGTIGGAPGRVNFASSAWFNTAAINSITMTPNTGTLFTQHSQFSLYGVK
jgi:hypothetical protein